MVSFSDSDKVILLPRVEQEERERIWYSSYEYRIFRAQILEQARRVHTNVPHHLRKEDTRGLENWSLDNFERRRKTVREGVRVVLLEQRCGNQTSVADKYAAYCTEPRLKAHLRGLEDQHDCMRIKLEDESRQLERLYRKRSLLGDCIPHRPAVRRRTLTLVV